MECLLIMVFSVLVRCDGCMMEVVASRGDLLSTVTSCWVVGLSCGTLCIPLASLFFSSTMTIFFWGGVRFGFFCFFFFPLVRLCPLLVRRNSCLFFLYLSTNSTSSSLGSTLPSTRPVLRFDWHPLRSTLTVFCFF